MSVWIRFLLALWLCAAVSGCVQSDQDEEKEPHYVLGQSRVNAMDYQGAVEAFEESLEVNPHSAAAHYQLAMLYENQQADPAAAIYHYEQYLKYDPTAENADIIRQHISTCKQTLAADVLNLPSTPVAQQQVEKLMDQNRQLQQQVDSQQAALKQWSEWYSNQMLVSKAPLATPQNNEVVQQPENQVPAQQPQQQVVTQQPVNPVNMHPETYNEHGRSHTVERGETAMAICRKYGIRLTDLETANPSMNPTHIHVGQVLNIP